MQILYSYFWDTGSRGGSRAAATSKIERFVRKVNDFQPLTIITRCSILDVAAALDPPLGRLLLGCALLLLAAILSELYEKPRREKDWFTEKKHRRICVRDITFLTARCPFNFIFCCFLSLLPFLSEVLPEWPQ